MHSANQESLEEEIKLVRFCHLVSLLVLSHHGEEDTTVNGTINFHVLGLLDALILSIDWHLLADSLLILQHVNSLVHDRLNNTIDVGLNLILAIVIAASELLVEHEVLSPLDNLLAPTHPLDEHLNEDERVQHNVEKDNRCPPL